MNGYILAFQNMGFIPVSSCLQTVGGSYLPFFSPLPRIWAVIFCDTSCLPLPEAHPLGGMLSALSRTFLHKSLRSAAIDYNSREGTNDFLIQIKTNTLDYFICINHYLYGLIGALLVGKQTSDGMQSG